MKKNAGSRVVPTSAGSLAGNGVSVPLLERLKRLEGLAAGVWTIRKAKVPVQLCWA
ncbi:hypothetical protein [Planococcus beijingensis]|uniref:hypothetical protein n=1 Tax=Planococcus beijingensis TaxID=2782551 RepID=UPI00193BC697|nr:hypothetical protein [Planococcus beijingensis]